MITVIYALRHERDYIARYYAETLLYKCARSARASPMPMPRRGARAIRGAEQP